VPYSQERWTDALAFARRVLAREPGNPDALIVADQAAALLRATPAQP
jgi:hypothetical protein